MYGTRQSVRILPVQAPGSSKRAAFTLIELLIVIGILAILMGLIFSVARMVMSNARAAATKSTLRKIDSLLTQRMEAFNRAIEQQNQANPDRPKYCQDLLSSFTLDQAKVLGRKRLFKMHFPQPMDVNINSALGGSEFVVDRVASQLTSESGTSVTNKVSAADSAEVLFYFLTKMPAFGAEAPDEDAFNSSELADTDGDLIPEVVDGWGQPLRFYRWPTRLIRPAAEGEEEHRVMPPTFQHITNPSASHEAWTYKWPVTTGYTVDGTITAGFGPGLLLGTLPPLPSGATRGPGSTLESEHKDPLASDPDDPRDKLHATTEAQLTQLTRFYSESLDNNDRVGSTTYHTPSTYHTPLVVSAGADQQLGLFEPHEVKYYGHLAQPKQKGREAEALLDNLTNRNTRAGGN